MMTPPRLARFVVPLALASAFAGSARAETLDPSFGSLGSVRLDLRNHDETAQDLALDSQGRILVAFLWQDPGAPDPVFWPALLRLTADGTRDSTFGNNGLWIGDLWSASQFPVRISLDDQDRPIVGWTTDGDPGPAVDSSWVIRRLTIAGSTDTEVLVAFDVGLSDSEVLRDLLVLPDGRIAAAGSVDFTVDDHDFALAILRENGGNLELDTSFSGDGKATIAFDLSGGTKYDACHTLLFAGGKLTLVGQASGPNPTEKLALARLDLVTGGMDPTFGTNGRITHGYVPLLGAPWNQNFARSAALTPSGGLVLAGSAVESSTSMVRPMALALDASGEVVASWGVLGWFLPEVHFPPLPLTTTWADFTGVAVESDGSAFLVGEVGNPNDFSQQVTMEARLSSLGTPSSEFSGDGFDFHSFVPDGAPFFDGWTSMLLLPGGVHALAAGWTRGHDSGVPRSDIDVLVARVVIRPRIFADGFESGTTSAWGP